MLIFTKVGALVPLTLLIGFMVVVVGFNDAHHVTQWGFPLLAAGIVSLGVGLAVNRKRKRMKLDRHHFMYLPMEYWGGALLVGAAVVFALEPLGLW